ncbi:hypothetical protein DESUT3_38100 [Desulfuromonas versatilis]|uniref:Sigma-54 factor interaction domain-containing protein n=1 Tax=Desulfuromonas versatilis TaxID=2802975 RepID=A0ABN6E2Z5_9BACT|nr:sigma 54-interacting transcriptional regulator [Desulfuromonas versatilis]BCR06741.1 hypothetical protein DESUT3_38100 [Desulfuromonas versatilis]
MLSQDAPFDTRNLPALAPDLVLAEQPGGRWKIQSISPALAALAGRAVEQLQGKALAEAFGDGTPPLAELAREVLENDRPLDAIPVSFAAPRPARLVAEVRPGGLSEDFRGRLVVFRFRRASPGEAGQKLVYGGMVGSSAGMREVFRKIDLYAASDAPVVVTGETGTGKELVARALHDQSPRHRGPFVAVNCSAISEELLESELFGHEKGAFTGAVRTHRGRFERADRGTLFLDEIGDMPVHTQAKLLRALEEGRIERVGAEAEQKVDVRVVAATNVTLEQAVGQGRFRADLYHRLSVLRIHLPPLRQRPEDIPHLAEHFLAMFNRKYAKQIRRLTPDALHLLQSYLWPGNIRELRNVLERVFVETQAEVIGARAFAEWIRERQDFSPGNWNLDAAESRPPQAVSPPYPLASERLLIEGAPRTALEAEIVPRGGAPAGARSTRPADLDVEEIRRAYQAAGGNLAGAARLLGVHRATLYRYLDKLGLRREDLEG